MLGTSREVDARDLIGIAERSMSAPIFELLKRPDELHVVEQAHLHPRFVEDSVRLMVAGTLDHYDDLSDGCFVLARQVNFETIHNHDVLAERHGAVRELRAELAGEPGAAHHSPPVSGCGRASRSIGCQTPTWPPWRFGAEPEHLGTRNACSDLDG
jgi:TIGR00294 family protein